jgi:hypothetical protein
MQSRWLLILLATASLTESPEDIAGKWKVSFAGPSGHAPKTVGAIVLDLKVDGDRVTGSVRIGVWPGEAPIADGKFDGDRIRFTATGHLGSTTGIPTCDFVVTVHGDDMSLTMTTIANAGGPLPPGKSFEYAGHRMPG